MAVKKRKGTPAKEDLTTSSPASTPVTANKVSTDQGGSYGIPYRRIAARCVVIVAIMLAVNYYVVERGERVIASSQETVEHRTVVVSCSQDYQQEKALYPECIPKRCGRFVTDTVVTEDEARHLLKMAKSGLALGGSSGGASILDIHSGALSKGDKFIDIYKVIEDEKADIFTEDDFNLYRKVKDRILRTIARHFGVPQHTLHLTSPTFFSRMTTKPAETVHDEYWHVHVDKKTYGSFHYTSLLYLSDYGTDFSGGRFIFVDSGRNSTVEPKLGRLSFFTSGSENPHHVEQMTRGTRYAITVSFTCDPEKAIPNPVFKRA